MAEGARKKPGAAGSSGGGPAAGTRPGDAAGPGEARGAERRRHDRVTATVPFQILSEAGREESFRLVDLSESGARIQVLHAVPPMTRIRVVLLLPGPKIGLDKDVRVDTSGVVVWCHRTEDAYDTGVFFPDLEEEQRDLLRTLVRAAS